MRFRGCFVGHWCLTTAPTKKPVTDLSPARNKNFPISRHTLHIMDSLLVLSYSRTPAPSSILCQSQEDTSFALFCNGCRSRTSYRAPCISCWHTSQTKCRSCILLGIGKVCSKEEAGALEKESASRLSLTCTVMYDDMLWNFCSSPATDQSPISLSALSLTSVVTHKTPSKSQSGDCRWHVIYDILRSKWRNAKIQRQRGNWFVNKTFSWHFIRVADPDLDSYPDPDWIRIHTVGTALLVSVAACLTWSRLRLACCRCWGRWSCPLLHRRTRRYDSLQTYREIIWNLFYIREFWTNAIIWHCWPLEVKTSLDKLKILADKVNNKKEKLRLTKILTCWRTAARSAASGRYQTWSLPVKKKHFC